MDLIVLHNHAIEMILAAGENIRKSFSNVLEIETKSDANDLVTNMDKETEQFLVERIHGIHKDFKIIGEEGTSKEHVNSLDGIVWVLDPIDGTMNFVRQQRNFAISIGVLENGVGKLGYIYDVVANELYYAIAGQGAFVNDKRLSPLREISLNKSIIAINASWATPNRRVHHEKIIQLVKAVRGTRSIGAATLEIMGVATGRLDAYISMRLAPWDYAAGLIIANEVGAIACQLNGEPVSFLNGSTFMIANPSISQEILENYIELKA